MNIQSIEYNQNIITKETMYLKTQNNIWLLLLIKTPVHLFINQITQKVSSNTFLLVDPNKNLTIKPQSEKYIFDLLIFCPNDQDKSFLSNLPINTPVNIDNPANISFIIRNMCYEYYSLNPLRIQNIELYFQILINKIKERLLYLQPPTNINKYLYYEELMNIRKMIYLHPENKWTINDFVEYLPISRSRFQHIYVETFGVSVTKDIMAMRLKKACDLLVSTTMPISEIASLCGYESSSYFMRKFKENLHITPTSYRNKQLNE